MFELFTVHGKKMETTVGFEPTNQGVAVPRLTTWLRRLIWGE